jgi:hypothetical protein
MYGLWHEICVNFWHIGLISDWNRTRVFWKYDLLRIYGVVHKWRPSKNWIFRPTFTKFSYKNLSFVWKFQTFPPKGGRNKWMTLKGSFINDVHQKWDFWTPLPLLSQNFHIKTFFCVKLRQWSSCPLNCGRHQLMTPKGPFANSVTLLRRVGDQRICLNILFYSLDNF